MKVLIVGGGGREHAIAWKVRQSAKVTDVFVAPGNAGTALEAGVENVAISDTDINGLLEFAKQQAIDLTIVGPEAPLVKGIVDRFQETGLAIFGPSQQAAQLEGSKAYSKAFLARHGIPTAAYQTFTKVAPAKEYADSLGYPVVIKADGLAAGKGVIIAQDQQQAFQAIDDMLSLNRFAEAGARIVIEEFLHGEEASFIVMCDGKSVLPLATSQDHKALGDGDTGPNTGGMGACSPAAIVTPELHQKVMEQVIWPTLHGMEKDGIPYTGFLYAGLMISPDGDLKVLEFNCRLGDPETQPLLTRMRSDLASLCLAATSQTLGEQTMEFDPRPALGVVMASGGYPYAYQSGYPIQGLDQVPASVAKVFHAGTTLEQGEVVNKGGRVLCVTAMAETMLEAQQQAYQAVSQISWTDTCYRTDIGYHAVKAPLHS
ncbi:phosphoribosylamine--glycine ligase [Dongshaea marina]|uniref:phosphoribosylamine--glycine ligase n=1 Tax=Dongshaea marina TaxID=2047966 RepID=UPI000D3E87F8|nr:phosphoribosylamine--glycine ligase [Dongshaea marina]